jgi:NAD(P)-dependent dehydrogenase (short-subunit alcohol dehydrogenase family)
MNCVFRLANENRRKEGGFPESAYRVSKAAEIALSMIQARELASKGIIVNGVSMSTVLLLYFMEFLQNKNRIIWIFYNFAVLPWLR